MATTVGEVGLELNLETNIESEIQSVVKNTSKTIESTANSTAEKINSILSDSTKSMKSQAASIAANYKKQGMNASDAMSAAWANIERGSVTVGDTVVSSGKKINNTFTGLESGTKNLENTVTSAAKKIGAALVAAFSVKTIASFTSQCLELGSDLQEVQNVVDVTFPTMTSKIDEFAQSAAESFGLSETMAKKFTGTFGSMAEAFGFSESEAADMATTLTGLAGDVASFYNITQDEAYTKLKSVFSGETETLKDLGIVMTQSALDAYALANGYGKTTSAMTEMEKVSLRYAFVQDQLNNATGDFARTSGSWANQVRLLSLQFDSLRASIGQGLINVFTPVIKWLNTLLSKLTTVANAFKNFTELITGGKYSSGSTSNAAETVSDNLTTATDAADALGTAATTASKGISSASKASSGVAKNLGKASDTVKKLKRELEGFDQITKVSDNSSSSSGSSGSGTGDSGTGDGGTGGTGSGSTGSTGDTSVDLGDTSEQLDSTSSSASKLTKLLGPLITAVNRLKESFSKFINVIKGGLKWCWDNVLVPLGKWTISKLAPSVLGVLAAVFDVLTAALEALAPEWQWIWDHLFKKIAKFAGDAIIKFLNKLDDGLEAIADLISKHPKAFDAIVTGILGLLAIKKVTGTVTGFKKQFEAFQLVWSGAGTIKEVAEELGVKIGKLGTFLLKAKDKFAVIKDTVSKVTGVFKTFGSKIATIGPKIASKVASIGSKFTALIAANPVLFAIIAAIVALVAACVLIYKNWDKIKKTKFGKFLISIMNTFKKLYNWVKKNVKPIKELKKLWEAFKNKTAELKADVKEKTEGALETLKEGWDSIEDKAAELEAEAKEKVSGAISVLKDGWDSVVDRKATLEAEAKEVAEGAISKLKDGWDSVTTKAETLTGEAKEVVSGALSKLKEGWDAITDKAAELKGTAVNAASGVLSTLKDGWDSIEDTTRTLTGYAVNAAGGVLSTLKDGWDSVKDTTRTLTGYAVNATGGTLSTLKDGWSKITSETRTLTGKAVNATGGTLSTLKSGWSAIYKKTCTLTAHAKNANADKLKTVKSYWGAINNKGVTLTARLKDLMTSSFKSMWNKMANAINKAITVINKLPGVNITARVSKLAQGGYVKKNTPQLAMIGDNRHQGEVVAPEDKLIEMARKAAEMSGGNGSNAEVVALLKQILEVLSNMNLTATVDGNSLKKLIVKLINEHTRATGTCEIII